MNEYLSTSDRQNEARDRLLAHIQLSSWGCWQWIRYRDPAGYGRLRYGGDLVYAHRLSYELFVAPIPQGLTIDHRCRNRGCVNPEHLDVVSVKENILRGTGQPACNARKTHCLRGHPLSGNNLYETPSRSSRSCRICRLRSIRKTVARVAKARRSAKIKRRSE